MITPALIILSIMGCSIDEPKEPIDGEWVSTIEEKGVKHQITMELAKDGKWKSTEGVNGKVENSYAGSYKIDGKKLTLIYVTNGKVVDNRTFTIKELTKEVLTLTDEVSIKSKNGKEITEKQVPVELKFKRK